MRNKIVNHIRAGHLGLYQVSPKEQQVEAELEDMSGNCEAKLSRCLELC